MRPIKRLGGEAEKLMLESIKGFRSRLALLTAGLAAENLIYLVYALFTRDLIDSAQNSDKARLLLFGLLLLGAVLIRVVMRYFLSYLGSATERRVIISLRGKIYSKLLKKRQDKLSEYHSAVLLERITDDAAELVSFPVCVVPDFIGDLVGLISAAGALFIMNSILPLCLIAVGALLSFVGRLLQKRAKLGYHSLLESSEQVNTYYQESLSNSLMLKVFGAEDTAGKKAEALEDARFGVWKKWFCYNQFLHTGVSAFFQLGYYAALMFCSFLILGGAMTYGTMTAILQLVGQIQSPFSNIGDVLSSLYKSEAAGERLLEVANLPDESSERMTAGEVKSLYRDLDAIVIDSVSFNYKDTKVLENASAEMQKGDFLLLSGRSGIGKSTLFKLILGVYKPSSGSIYFRTKGGKSIPLDESARGLFAYVPQNHMVFSGTIRENLTFFSGERTDAQIAEAVRLSDAEEFVQKLPLGLDSPIGERGQGLSQGQAQRLAIARALLTDAPILILDEATSALDADTEERVLSNLSALDDKSVMFITHRAAAQSYATKRWRIDGCRILAD